MSRRMARASTLRRQIDATASRLAAYDAIQAGATLVASNRTDITAGTIHHGTAARFVALGICTWDDAGHLVAR